MTELSLPAQMALPESGLLVTVPITGGYALGCNWLVVRGQENYMALRLEDKKALVAEVNEVAASALSGIAAEYRGMTVAQMTEFRAKARSEGVYVRVVKNTLAKRAIDGTEFECLADSLTGPIILAFSTEDPGSAARVVKEFAKECGKESLQKV